MTLAEILFIPLAILSALIFIISIAAIVDTCLTIKDKRRTKVRKDPVNRHPYTLVGEYPHLNEVIVQDIRSPARPFVTLTIEEWDAL